MPQSHVRVFGAPAWRGRALAVLLAGGLAACATGEMMTGNGAEQASLYERLGGQEAITLVVEEFIGNVAEDPRINERFAGTDIDHLQDMLVEQICEATGGPCTYTGLDMRTAHAGMDITDGEFDALVEDLVAALDTYNVPEREKNELLSALAGMRDDVVGV